MKDDHTIVSLLIQLIRYNSFIVGENLLMMKFSRNIDMIKWKDFWTKKKPANGCPLQLYWYIVSS